MRNWNKAAVSAIVLALTTVGLTPAQADTQTKQIGDVTVSIGTGVAILSLPDVTSTLTHTTNSGPFTIFQSFDYSKDFSKNTGWALNGGVSAPFGGNYEIGLNGFWARIKGSGSDTCTGTAVPQTNCLIAPLVDNPATQQIGGTLGAQSITYQADRKVDQWGIALEGKRFLASSPMISHYLALGADVRGINQDLSAVMNGTTGLVDTYDESLNTTYYGVFVAWGGTVPVPTLGIEGLFRLQGGVYNAHTNYSGSLVHVSGPLPGGGGDPTGSLSLSTNHTSFIGGATLELRKQLTRQAAFSVKGEFEYYSYVPMMVYNNTDRGPVAIVDNARQDGTVINSDHAYSLRLTARLTVGFAPETR